MRLTLRIPIISLILTHNLLAIGAQEQPHHRHSHSYVQAKDSAALDTNLIASAPKHHHHHAKKRASDSANAIASMAKPDTIASDESTTGAHDGILSLIVLLWIVPAIIPTLIAGVKGQPMGRHFLRALWRSWILETITVMRLRNVKNSTTIPDASTDAQTGELDFASSVYHNIDLTEAEQKKYSEFINESIAEAMAQPPFDKLGLTDLTESEQKKLFALYLITGSDADQESRDHLAAFFTLLFLRKQGKESEISPSSSENIARSISEMIDLTEPEQKKYSEFIANISQVVAQQYFDNVHTDLKASELTEPVRKKIMSLYLLAYGPEADQESGHRLAALASFLKVQKEYYATSADIPQPSNFESRSGSTNSNQKEALEKHDPAPHSEKEARFYPMNGWARGDQIPILIANGNKLYKAFGGAALAIPIAEIKDGKIYRCNTPGAGVVVASTDGNTVGKGYTKMLWLKLQGNQVIESPGGGTAAPFIEGENCTKEQLAMAAAILKLGYN
jgi:hypothetical protein